MSFPLKVFTVFSELIEAKPSPLSLDNRREFRQKLLALPTFADHEESLEAIADLICEWVEQNQAIKKVFKDGLTATPQERSAKGLRSFDEASPDDDPDYIKYLLELLVNTMPELEQQPAENLLTDSQDQ